MQLVSGILSDILGILFWLIDIYVYVVVVMIVMSWLFQFDILSRRQPIVAQIADILYRLTDPVLRPIRRRLPNLGGIDLSPLVLIIGLQLLKQVISRLFLAVFG
jgi:YggT family protein